jgi:hypothetical protein
VNYGNYGFDSVKVHTQWLLAKKKRKLEEVPAMFKSPAKLAALVVAFVALMGSVKMLQSGAPDNPLQEWIYPKSKRSLRGTDRAPLRWAAFTTTDDFKKVWDFYWNKVVHGPAKPSPGVKGGTLYREPVGVPEEHTTCAHFIDKKPTAKVSVFVIRKQQGTVSITIFRRAE